MNMRIKSVGNRRGQERGFTLTEIAIVLGIIGLILGAIWVAAAAVYNNMRTTKTTTQLLDIAQNVRKMYATSGIVDPNADITNFGAPASNLTYIQAGIFPNDTLNGTDNLATAAQDSWNGYIIVRSDTGAVASDSFQVAFQSIPQQACINLITGTTGVGKDPGLFFVSTAAGNAMPALAGGNTVALPVLASTAQTMCANATQGLGFSFKLK